jgi:hypothetical protein
MRSFILTTLLFVSYTLLAQEVQEKQGGSTVPSTVRMICVERSIHAPLYIYDGFPIDSSSLSIISADDVKRFTILKPKRAKTLYGSAARNGVIEIESQNVSYLQVLDSLTGFPIPGASVELVAVDDKADIKHFLTDDSGRVRIDHVNDKRVYWLTVATQEHDLIKIEYRPAKRPFAIVKVKADG